MRNLFFILILSLVNNFLYGQYRRITVTGNPGATQTFDNNMVTLNYFGFWTPWYQSTYFCQAGPYEIGFVSFGVYTPFGYTFTFARPVNHIRTDMAFIHENDTVNFGINGTSYFLQPGNLYLYPSSCNEAKAITQGGNLVGTLGYSPSNLDKHTGARIQLHDASGVNSVTIDFLGIIDGLGNSGVKFSIYFGQIEANNSGPACLGGNVQLHGDSSITEPGTFLWRGPSGYSSNLQHPFLENLDVSDTGIYTLMFITGVDTLTDTTYVGLLPGPDKPVVAANINPVCEGETFTLTVASSAGATYSWQGPNDLFETRQAISIRDVRENNEGLYFATVTQYGCSLSDSITITVNHPVTNKISKVACTNEGYLFNGRYLTEAGIYTDTFIGANGCDSLSQLQLILLPSPQLAILPVDKQQICISDTINLTAHGEGDYYWYNDDYLIGNASSVQVVLIESKTPIKTICKAENECTDTVYITIEAEDCCINMAYFPTAFSPNGDGKNDFFGIANLRYVQFFRIEVFNRWGQLIFVSRNMNDKWDGMYKGTPAELGVYHYNLIYECQEEKRQKSGQIVLVR